MRIRQPDSTLAADKISRRVTNANTNNITYLQRPCELQLQTIKKSVIGITPGMGLYNTDQQVNSIWINEVWLDKTVTREASSIV